MDVSYAVVNVTILLEDQVGRINMDMLKMRVLTVLAIALTISLILLGIVGLALSYLNPIEWIITHVPTCLDYIGCWIEPSLVYTSGIIETLNTNWLVTLPTSLVVLSTGLLQPESRRNIRAFPFKVLSAYRKVCVWRDWLFAKIEYLNGESAKWRRAFNILKSPYSFLRMMGLSPQMAIGLLVAGSTATTAVTVAEVTQGRSFANGDAGIYSAPLDTPIFADQEYNTLRLDLGATSVGNITIENISLGTAYTGSALPSGESNVIYVGGIVASSNPTFAQTYLEVGHLIIDRWRCERLDISHSEIHKLIISGNASDGQSISAVAGTPRDRGINGGNRADDMTTTGGYYDMLKITSASSGVNGKVDVLKLSNIYSKGGACTIKYIKAGTMEVTLNEIGGDETLSTKAFTVATSVIYKSFTNTSNVEVSMPVPAAQ
jgi:hypothetical protein